jgi:hypothetical protein
MSRCGYERPGDVRSRDEPAEVHAGHQDVEVRSAMAMANVMTRWSRFT